MKVNFFLYTRSKEHDYRWTHVPPNVSQGELKMLVNVRNLMEQGLSESTNKNLPLIFSAYLNSGWYFGIFHETNRTDIHNREIYDFSGISWQSNNIETDRKIIVWAIQNLSATLKVFSEKIEIPKSYHSEEKTIEIAEYESALANVKLNSACKETSFNSFDRNYTREGLQQLVCKLAKEQLENINIFAPNYIEGFSIIYERNNSYFQSVPKYQLPTFPTQKNQSIGFEANSIIELKLEITEKQTLFRRLMQFVENLLFNNRKQIIVTISKNGKIESINVLGELNLPKEELGHYLKNRNSNLYKNISQNFDQYVEFFEKKYKVTFESEGDFHRVAKKQ